MTNRSQHLNRDQVLLAFQDAFKKPTAENIIEWVERYPEYAEDIRDHATIAHEIAALATEHSENEVDDRTLNISFSHALNGLYAGDQETKFTERVRNAASFQELLSALEKTIATLVTEISNTVGVGIAKSVIADLINGAMKPPIGRRLKDAMMRVLLIDSASFDQKTQYALNHPRIGMAKSSVTPQLKKRSYAEIIKASSMDEAQKQYWLGED